MHCNFRSSSAAYLEKLKKQRQQRILDEMRSAVQRTLFENEILMERHYRQLTVRLRGYRHFSIDNSNTLSTNTFRRRSSIFSIPALSESAAIAENIAEDID